MIIKFLTFILLSSNPAPSYTDGIAAIVGKKIILTSEVKQNIKPQLPKLCNIPEKGPRLAALNKFWEQALSSEVNMILMELEAEKHNIEVGPTQVNAAIQMVIKKNNFNSLNELKQALAKKNVSYFLMRKQLKNTILRQQLLANVVHAKVNVGEEAIKSYYLDKVRKAGAEENVDFQQIFIPHNKNPEKHLIIIKKALKNKVDFKTIALKFAKFLPPGKSFLETGVSSGLYPPQINRHLFPDKKKKDNQVIGPLKTDKGFYFIKITNRNESGYLPYEKVRDKLKRELINEKMQKKTQNWLKNLRNKYLVNIKLTTYPQNFLCSNK